MSKNTIIKLIKGELPLDFNWNNQPHKDSPIPKMVPADPTVQQITNIEIVSEDLRDGLHGVPLYPSVRDMRKYIDTVCHLGIKIVTVGMYSGTKNKVDTATKNLLKYLKRKHVHVTPIVLVPAVNEALIWSGKCKKINPKLSAIIFMGTAPSRLLVEEWSKDYILTKLEWAAKTAASKYHIEVIGATEHTTQTPPEFLKEIITVLVKNGAKYFCIADTIGTARPVGTVRIIRFVKKVLHDIGAKRVQIDWHGHNDLGNGVANAMAAISAGANRIHVVARGIGERAGNTKMESILLNCTEILRENRRQVHWKLDSLDHLVKLYDKLTTNPPPTHGPLGTRAFSTSLGIHTSAMLKAELLAKQAHKMNKKSLAKKLSSMAKQIYSAIDATKIGQDHTIHVGPWSGKSTVRLAALKMGYNSNDLSETTIADVLSTAKKLGRELTTEELRKLLKNSD